MIVLPWVCGILGTYTHHIVPFFWLVQDLLVLMWSVLPSCVDCTHAYGDCSLNWCRFSLCLFFQLVAVVLLPIGSAAVAE